MSEEGMRQLIQFAYDNRLVLCADASTILLQKVLVKRFKAVDNVSEHVLSRENSCADVVVDCTGSPEGLATATSLVRPGGTLVMKTTVHDLGPASPTAWVVEEITLVGSRCGPFAPALRMLASGLVDPTPLITGVLPLEQGLTALEQARAPGGLKVLLDARH